MKFLNFISYRLLMINRAIFCTEDNLLQTIYSVEVYLNNSNRPIHHSYGLKRRFYSDMGKQSTLDLEERQKNQSL
jgi:hypothetical protein